MKIFGVNFFKKKEPEPIPQDDILVDFASFTLKERRQFLKQIPVWDVKRLELQNCNVFDDGCCHGGNNFIPRIYRKVVQNQHIESLELGKEFISSYPSQEPVEDPRTHIPPRHNISLQELVKMKALKKLIIPVPNEVNFEHLEEYLTNTQCTLETLHLKLGLNDDQLSQMKRILPAVSSLKYYEGPDAKEMQSLLDERWSSPLTQLNS